MRTKILTALRESEGYLSGQELCERFGVSRTAIWKIMNQLKEEGYVISSVKNKGYHLEEIPDLLSQKEIESLRKTKWAGCETHYFDEITSTNIEAKNLGEHGAPHGTLVVADQQTNGRGRRGRNWSSPKNSGIFFTLLIRPEVAPDHASMVTLIMAMAVRKGIKKVTGLDTQIKWPNDLVLNKKKVCGILTEMSAQVGYIDYIVIGTGINVHNASFPEELSEKASSLYLESGTKWKRSQILEGILEAFEEYYNQYIETEDLTNLQKEYNTYLVNQGKEVLVLDPQGEYTGIALGINEKGELLVDIGGEIRYISTGEVSVRGIYGYV